MDQHPIFLMDFRAIPGNSPRVCPLTGPPYSLNIHPAWEDQVILLGDGLENHRAA